MRRFVPVALALTLAFSATAAAQEMPTAEKWTNVEWYSVTTWYLSNPDEALTLWTEHFLPVAMDVMPGTTCLWFITGEPHLTCSFPMPDGPAAMEWRLDQTGVEFMAELAAREGEAMMELFDSWENAVSRSTSHIALKHTGGM